MGSAVPAHSLAYLTMFLRKSMMLVLAIMAVLLLQDANTEPQFGYPPHRGPMWRPTWMPQWNQWRLPRYNRPQYPDRPPVDNRSGWPIWTPSPPEWVGLGK